MVVELRAARESLKARHSALLAEHHHLHHPVWGQILKTGYQNSRFAHQVREGVGVGGRGGAGACGVAGWRWGRIMGAWGGGGWVVWRV